MWTILLLVLEDYGIVRQLGAIVADNATTNDVLCRLIQAHFYTTYKMVWKVDEWQIRCISHIINLVVQAFLFTKAFTIEELESYDAQEEGGELLLEDEAKKAKFWLLGPLGQAHNIVVYMQALPSCAEEFKKLAGRIVLMDNRTRWNSQFNMLTVLLNLQPLVEKFCHDHIDELAKDILTTHDQAKLCTIQEFLSCFSSGTLKAEGDSRSVDKTLLVIDVLIVHLKNEIVSFLSSQTIRLTTIKQVKYSKKKDKPSKDFLERLKAAQVVLDRYYLSTDMSPLYAAALILNPSRRTRYIQSQWPSALAKPTLAKVKKLWERYRDEVQILQPNPLAFQYGSNKVPKDLDVFEQIALSLQTVTRLASEDEYKDYNSGDSYKPGKIGALGWWLQDTQRQRWPRLSLMAIDILLIPPMSDKPERVFSGACHMVTQDKGQLELGTIEHQECLKHQKRSGILETFLEEVEESSESQERDLRKALLT